MGLGSKLLLVLLHHHLVAQAGAGGGDNYRLSRYRDKVTKFAYERGRRIPKSQMAGLHGFLRLRGAIPEGGRVAPGPSLILHQALDHGVPSP